MCLDRTLYESKGLEFDDVHLFLVIFILHSNNFILALGSSLQVLRGFHCGFSTMACCSELIREGAGLGSGCSCTSL